MDDYRNPLQSLAAESATSEVAHHVDLIHTSLAGMAAIILVLLLALGLPVFGFGAVTNKLSFIIMVVAAFGGIGYLYFMNYRVHFHVSSQARLTEVLVNSLGQGFLSFDQQGICGRVYSQACIDLLETVPGGSDIQDVLRIPDDQRVDFKDWMDILFMPNHALGFDDVVKFLPQFFAHSQGRRISLVYRPIRDKAEALVQVVVIATDRTEEFDAQNLAQKQQNYADMICRIFKERNQFLATITHIRKFIELAEMPTKREEGSTLLRMLHTLKAAVKHFHLDELGRLVHFHETALRNEFIETDDDFRKALDSAVSDIRNGLASVMTQVHDLIGQDYENQGHMHEVEEGAIIAFAEMLHRKKVDPEIIRQFLSQIAAVPAIECFKQFDRELRDLSEITGKQIKPIRYTGTNPRILAQPIHEFLFSLTHICRNIIDHGIEPPVTRLARGKDPEGQISVHCDILIDNEQKGEWLQIVISDDGNGIDPSRVRAKLATLDPNGAWRNEDDQAIIQYIFSWGFSTRESVSDLSGQGVGMEAVEREVHLLGGSIKVYSELYHGVKFDIRIPYILDLHDKRVPSSLAMQT